MKNTTNTESFYSLYKKSKVNIYQVEKYLLDWYALTNQQNEDIISPIEYLGFDPKENPPYKVLPIIDYKIFMDKLKAIYEMVISDLVEEAKECLRIYGSDGTALLIKNSIGINKSRKRTKEAKPGLFKNKTTTKEELEEDVEKFKKSLNNEEKYNKYEENEENEDKYEEFDY